jgi:2,4-dienoyl-CoA reductase-like NADH-dependent reductase (Old Yellow Enzyme family)
MTREMAPDGIPTADMARYYARRAAGGAGLIITEGVAVDAAGRFGTSVPRLFGRDVLPAWRALVSAVHDEHAAILAQLWHVGAFSPSMVGMVDSLDAERLSPSGLAAPGRPFGRAMLPVDIDRTIEAFATAAVLAQAAGFDGVEIHGAHGYLIDQFLWNETNRRTDIYGGGVRFAAEVVGAIRAATGPTFTIGFRLSQWKQLDYGARIAVDPTELAAVVGPLADAGVDLFHCSTRRFWEPAFPDDERPLSAWVRLLSGQPTMAVGSATLDVDFKAPSGKLQAGTRSDHIAWLEDGLAKGWFDLVAVGRAMIANPDWARRVERGEVDGLRAFEGAMLNSLD